MMRVNRRTCLAAIGGGVTTALAGCTSSLPLIGSDSPEDVAEEYITAIMEDDREAANELIHPDSPGGEYGEDEWDFIQEFSPDDAEVVEIEENDDQATATVETTYESDGEETTEEGEIELRTHDGEWMIWRNDGEEESESE